MDRRFLRLTAAAVCVAAASACVSPVQSYNGFRPERNNVEIPDPQPGVDTRDTVRQRFGSPSSTAVFDLTTWYYVSQVQEQLAFFRPAVTERQIMAVRFDGETVAEVEKFGIERGRVIAYNEEATPTRGRELGLLEQIFGNIGSTPPIRTDENEGGPRRNR